MITTEIPVEELELLQQKADKLDRIEAIVASAYEFDEKGNLVDNGQDLCTIGEKVCLFLGWL